MRKLFKVLLVINVIIIYITLIVLIFGAFNSFFNGINENWLFEGTWLSGPKVMVYGKEAIDNYFMLISFIFYAFSVLGIIPILNLPVITFITKKIKLYKRINSFVILLIPFVVCIFLHIISFYFSIILLQYLLPYIECIILSYMILYGKKKD